MPFSPAVAGLKAETIGSDPRSTGSSTCPSKIPLCGEGHGFKIEINTLNIQGFRMDGLEISIFAFNR